MSTLNSNSNFVSMSREDLENEIINLKRINVAQSLKIDDHEQKMYELKRQLSTAKAMEEHLSCEIDSLQKNDKSENDELLKKISALEDEIHTLKQTNTDHVQFYEAELQAKNNEIENIVEKTKANQQLNVETSNDEISKYTDEICDLKLKVEELTEQLLDFETKYQEVSLTNNSLANQITELSSQLNELRDCLNAKKEELAESKELSRNLQDDMIVMQMEIDKFKSLPMEKAAKGNSLFAEVDDNRVKLQKTMETMKTKYMDMRRQYTYKCQELQKLHMEYAALIKVIENKNDSSDDKSELIQTYERHFERLNENVKSLENELVVQKNAFTKLISKDWKCAQEMISITREEVQTLQRKLNAESLGLITSESNHYKTKRELKKWQAETMQLRAQILSLNQKIEDFKILTSPPAVTQEESSNVFKKSCLKNTLVPLCTEIDWDLTTKGIDVDYSILNPKLNDDSQITDLNFTSDITDNSFTNNSVFESTSLEVNERNLMDELKPVSEVPNNEIDSKENITNNFQNNTFNDTVDNLILKMKKVSFDQSPVEQQRIGKLGGSKYNNKVVHTSSMDELKSSSKVSVSNTEINSKENITNNFQNNTLNDTADNLNSKMKKVTFDQSTVEQQRSGKLGGRKIIIGKAVHIPSIKKN